MQFRVPANNGPSSSMALNEQNNLAIASLFQVAWMHVAYYLTKLVQNEMKMDEKE